MENIEIDKKNETWNIFFEVLKKALSPNNEAKLTKNEISVFNLDILKYSEEESLTIINNSFPLKPWKKGKFLKTLYTARKKIKECVQANGINCIPSGYEKRTLKWLSKKACKNITLIWKKE